MTCNLTNMEDLFSRSTVVVHILFLILSVGYSEVTNFGLCIDPDCSDPLGLGETTIKYNTPEKDKISFENGHKVKIFSRDAGPKNDLLGVEIEGKRGYVPKTLVRETLSYLKNKTLVPAKSKFGAPSSTPGNTVDKPAEKVTHSSSVNEPVSSTKPSADDPVPSSSHSDESIPSSSVSDESVPSSRPSVTESVLSPPFMPEEKSGQSNEKALDVETSVHSDESIPSASISDESVPSSRPSVSKSVPSPPSMTEEKSSQSNKKAVNVETGAHSIHSDESIPSASISDESVPSSRPSVNESVPSPPSMTEEKSSQSDEKAVGVETSVHAGSSKNLSTETENELEDQINHSTETSAMDRSKSNESGSVETDSVDISSSIVVPVSMGSSTHSSQSDLKTSDGLETGSVRDVQHSSDQLKNSDHAALRSEDTVSAISPTGAENMDSYSTEHFDHKHSDSAAVPFDINSSMSSNTVLPSHTEEKERETVRGELSNAHAQVTESLPQVVDAIVESISSGSLKLDGETVQQLNQSSPPDTHEKETVVVSDEIASTLAFLEKQGINVSDVAPDNKIDSELPSELPYNTHAKSQSVYSDSHAHNSHKGLHRKPPLVNSLEEGLKSIEAAINKRSLEEHEVSSKVSQQHSPNETPEKRTEVFSEDSTIMETQGSTLAKTEDYTHDQHLHTSSRHPDAGSDVPVVTSSQGHSVHTSFNSESSDEYTPIPPVPNGQLKNTHHDLGMADKREDDQVHFTRTENVDSGSSVSSTKDFNEATVQSESYITSRSSEDYSSSVTETTFVSRHLKSEVESDDLKEEGQYEKQDDVSSDSSSFSFLSVSDMLNNSFEELRSFIEVVMMWLPEPLHVYLLDLQSKGVPPRAAVFTALIAIPTIVLFISIIYIRQSSKEKNLLVKLSGAEQKLFLASTERDVLKEDIAKLQSQVNTLQSDLEQEQKSAFIFKKKLEKSENLSQSSSTELRTKLKDLENQVEMKTSSISALQTALEQCKETNSLLQRKLQEEESAVSTITVQLQEFEEEVRTLQKEREEFLQNEANYKEKIVELEQSCNQLLEEAEVWNSRVNELSQQLQSETSCREEFESRVQSKDSEIQSLQNAVMNLQVIQELKNSSDTDENNFEDKIKQMLDTSAVEIKLKKAEDERDTIVKSFESERSRVMELEVELLEAKSETEKLKSNYNQALQDKTEAQTKLEVLSNYFKDKEMQLQKELGVQEAVRQQKEEDASFAARRVNLIEEENSSYKYQVATLKQEIEETERNYKNQVALQEKKAHENWLAARAAERKLEEVKQEAAQLRQRLTLLEREQENWLNSSRDEIVRPVPKRPGGPNGEIGTQEINRSKDSSSGSLPLPPEMLPPLRPPVLPLDRPLPPLRMPMMEPPRGFPPPPMDYFDFGPIPIPFSSQPWHPRGHHPLDRRTPSSYERGHLTPPVSRRHQSPTISDKEIGRRSASPKEISSRGSHTSSPPHPLPHFHDIPPPPGSYDFRHGPPPPPLNSRYPLPPPPRREFLNQGPGLTRADSRNNDMITSTPRGTHQLPPAQDRKHQQPSSRV